MNSWTLTESLILLMLTMLPSLCLSAPSRQCPPIKCLFCCY